ncbi:MAG: beta strand repeat-containing protein [Thainema sp.]
MNAPSQLSLASSTLTIALLTAQERLTEFASETNFLDDLHLAFGNNFSVAEALAIQDQWLNSDFTGIPQIEIRTSDELRGAFGAYAALTDTIYISKEFLEYASTDQVVTVLLEEIGHSVDTRLNLQDSLGDEGEIFSAFAWGQELSSIQLSALQAQNDTVILNLDGILIPVETASLIGEQVDVDVRFTTFADNFVDVSLFSTTFTVGTGQEVTNQAVSTTFQGGGFPQTLSGNISIDVSSDTIFARFDGTAQPGEIKFVFSSLVGGTVTGVVSATEIANSGVITGVNATRTPTVSNNIVTTGFFPFGFQPGTNITQTVQLGFGSPNQAPSFNDGTSTILTLSEDSTAISINSLLDITDADTGNSLTWSIFSGPSNGSLSGFNASGTSNGGIVTPTGLTYTPTANYSGSDSFVIRVSDGVATDTITVNVTVNNAPEVSSINRSGSNPTSADSVTFNVNFSESVTGVNAGDFSLATTGTASGSIASVSGSGSSYTVTVNGISGDGTLGLNLVDNDSIANGTSVALGGVGISGSGSGSFTGQTYTIDNTAPSFTSITRQTPATGFTNADTLVFLATFNEAVQNVDATDFTVTGTTAGITNVNPVSASTYAVTVSGGDLANLNGTVGLNLASGQNIQDLVGQALPSGEPTTDETYGLENTQLGDIVITEIMQNPGLVSDANGEWFELYNATGSDIDINGWTIFDNGADSHVINNVGSLIIAAGGYLVLGRNASTAINGGVAVDYAYGSAITLANADDEIVLTNRAGVEIDRVEYDGGPNFPDPIGASMALLDPALNNNVGSNWVTSNTPFGNGDLGTPGAANVFLPTISLTTSDSSATEGADTAVFTVSRGTDTVGDLTVLIDLSGDAAATDYSFSTGTVSNGQLSVVIPAGQSSLAVTVTATDDGLVEANETLTLDLASDAAYVISGTNNSSGITMVSDDTSPVVTSITRVGTELTNASSVDYTVTFNRAVAGVDATDFTLTTTGITGASVTNVTTSDNITYTVTVNTGTGDGTLRLDLSDDNSITDGDTNPLGGALTGDGDFITGDSYTIDKTVPVSPVIVGIADDTGSSTTDGVTSDPTLIFNGTAEANSTVEVVLDGNSLGTTTTDGNGDWSFDYTGTTLGEGTYGLVAIATDAAGNESDPTTTFNFTIDTTEPGTPTITGISDDSGTAADGITNDNTLIFRGTAEADSSVEVFIDGGSIGTTTADEAGNWSFDYTGTTLNNGTYILTAEATDAAGNLSATSTGFEFTVDTTDPLAPVTVSITTDTGLSSTDGITSDTTLVFAGTAEADSTVEVLIDGSSVGTTTADGSGNWSFDYQGTTLAEGTYTVTATATDAAGNVSAVSTAFDVTVDTTAPTVTAVTANLATIRDSNIGTGTFTLTVDFSEEMDTSVEPTLSFPTAGEDPTNTITFDSGRWLDSDTYVATYSVADANEVISNIDVRVAGAQDIAGNTQTASTQADEFSILTESIVEFSAINFVSDETGGTSNAVTLTRTGDTSGTSTVQVSITGGSATGNDTDYTSGGFPLTVTFNVGETSQTIAIPVIDDNLVEGDETITLNVASSSNATIGTQSATTLTLQDNDTATVSITSTTNAAEPDTDGQFVLSMTNPSSVDTIINYTVTGSATNGSDYSQLTGTATILANQTSTTIDIAMLDDNLVEGNETIVLSLQSVSSSNSASILVDSTPATVTITDDARLFQTTDVNGDNRTDIIWRNTATGSNSLWTMEGAVRKSATSVLAVQDTRWEIGAIADFDKDGRSDDILWRQRGEGKQVIWFMQGGTRVGTAPITTSTGGASNAPNWQVPDNWEIVGVGNYDGQEFSDDLVWQDRHTGEVGIWLMTGTLRTSITRLDSNPSSAWTLAAVGDFENTGISDDFIWRNHQTGQTSIWIMDGTTKKRVQSLDTQTLSTAWEIQGVGDFDGPFQSYADDIFWRNTQTGQSSIWFMQGTGRAGTAALDPQVTDTNWVPTM